MTVTLPRRLCSMTGFGREDVIIAGVSVQAEIRSVNHRHCQVRVRAPKFLSTLESELEAWIRARIHRGRVDASIVIGRPDGRECGLISPERAASIASALRVVAEHAGLSPVITLKDVLAVAAQGGEVSSNAVDEEQMKIARSALEAAFGHFLATREREGEALRTVLLERVQALEAALSTVRELAPARNERFEASLRQRILTLVERHGIDEARVLQEVATMAERLDIQEECDRTEAHLVEVRATLDRGGAVGRRLDFLAQELHRECSTMGTKGADAALSRVVVTMKEEVERLREQVQNLE